MGAQFAVPVVTDVTPVDLRTKLHRLASGSTNRPAVLVADACEGDDVSDARVETGAVLVLGAERDGPSRYWAGGRRVTIPQQSFDSLNVAMAGTILLYELRRQRSARRGS
jgi:tRNA G18 (ribose-2'-O)-methylase SpoU